MINKKRKFNTEWTFNYFITECSSKLICLICREIISTIKEYSCKRHYELKHLSSYNGLTGELRRAKIEELKYCITAEKSKFKSNFTDNNLNSILKVATSGLEPNIDKITARIQSNIFLRSNKLN